MTTAQCAAPFPQSGHGCCAVSLPFGPWKPVPHKGRRPSEVFLQAIEFAKFVTDVRDKRCRRERLTGGLNT